MQGENNIQKIFSRNLKKLLSDRDVTQLELSKYLGVSNTTVYNYVNGFNMPRMDKIDKICDFFGISRSTLIEDGEPDDSQSTLNLPKDEPILEKSKKIVKIPVLGTIAAGIPIEAIENIEDYEELIISNSESEKNYFCIKVKGDSMEPRIKNGDLIICKKQSDVDNGDIAAVLVNGHEATVKKIKKDANGIWLIPNNPMYEPRFYNNAEINSCPVTILGKVIELRGKF